MTDVAKTSAIRVSSHSHRVSGPQASHTAATANVTAYAIVTRASDADLVTPNSRTRSSPLGRQTVQQADDTDSDRHGREVRYSRYSHSKGLGGVNTPT